MRLWPKTKDRGWYGPFDLMEDVMGLPERGAVAAYHHVPGVQPTADWLKDRGSDVEKSKVGGAILSTSPSVGVTYGDEGLHAQAGLNRAQGGPSFNMGGQAGQAGAADQGTDWRGTFMSLLPLLAQGAGTYMQYGREGKDRERMAGAQKHANLINILAGRNVAVPDFTPSKVSGWEKLANIGGQALQAGQQQRAQAEQAGLRDLKRRQLEGQLTDAATARQEQQRTAREDRIRQEARAGAARGELRGAGVPTFGEEMGPTTDWEARRADQGYTPSDIDIFDITKAEQVRGRAEQDQADKLTDLNMELAELRVDAAKIELGDKRALAALRDHPVLGARTGRNSLGVQVSSHMGAYGNAGLNFAEFWETGDMVDLENRAMAAGQPLAEADKRALYTVYADKAKVQTQEINKKNLDIKKDIDKTLTDDPFIAERDTYKRGILLTISAYENLKGKGEEDVAQGLSDIQAAKMLARYQDPGGVVREAEFNTIAGAVAALETWDPAFQWEKYKGGARFPEAARVRILDLMVDGYEKTRQHMDATIDDFIGSHLKVIGANSPEEQALFKMGSNWIRLPPINLTNLKSAYKNAAPSVNYISPYERKYLEAGRGVLQAAPSSWKPDAPSFLGNLGKVNPQVTPGAPAQGDAEAYLRRHEAFFDELDYPGITEGRKTRESTVTSPYQF